MSSNHQAMGQLSQFFAQMGTVHKTYLDFCRRAVGGTLSRAEIGLLLALSENCNAANDLCRSLPLSKGMVSQTLASLQKRGLVVVERSEEDRRVHPITLSPQGQSMVAEACCRCLRRPHDARRQPAGDGPGRVHHVQDPPEHAAAQALFVTSPVRLTFQLSACGFAAGGLFFACSLFRISLSFLKIIPQRFSGV